MAKTLLTRRTALTMTAASATLATLGMPALAQSAPEPSGSVDMDKLLEEGALAEQAMGEADAPVTVVEYASMTCPHCRTFHEQTLPTIKEEYVDTGKVRLIFREFPFDPRATAAFMLARCAPGDKYFPMVDALFKQQDVWARAESPVPPLFDIAKLAGFTQESFQSCLTNQELLDDINAVRERGAEEFGVSATPTFFINGDKFSGALTVEQMSAIFDSKL